MSNRTPTSRQVSPAMVERFLGTTYDSLMAIADNLEAILASEAASTLAAQKAAEAAAAAAEAVNALAAVQAALAANQALTGADIAALLDAHLGTGWRTSAPALADALLLPDGSNMLLPDGSRILMPA